MPVDINPIVSAVPVTVQPTQEITYDTWFLKDFSLYATPERKFNAKVNWVLGKLNQDGSSSLSNQKGFCFLEDLLSEASLTENPEIAAVLQQFLGALDAVSRRKGAIQ